MKIGLKPFYPNSCYQKGYVAKTTFLVLLTQLFSVIKKIELWVIKGVLGFHVSSEKT
jgi:hypothetical protein